MVNCFVKIGIGLPLILILNYALFVNMHNQNWQTKNFNTLKCSIYASCSILQRAIKNNRGDLSMKKLSILLVLVLIVSSLLVGCSPDEKDKTKGDEKEAFEETQGTKEKDTIVLAMGAEPSTLDGNGKNDDASLKVRTQIYENLITHDEDMNLVPTLAESWEQVDDTTIIFNIRKGVKFHNGDEMTANDALFSLKRAYDMGYAATALEPIDFENSEVVDDYTLKIILHQPFAPIFHSLCEGEVVVVPQNVIETNDENYLANNPVGTGPYKLKKWIPGDRIELVKNEDYWQETKGVKNLVVRFISETANRAIELEVGGVDIAYDISPTDIPRLEDNPEVKLDRAANLSTTYIGFNCTKAPFDDYRVRLAVGHALDLDSIVNAIYLGTGSRAVNIIAPSVWGYSDNIPVIDYDAEKAKELLAEAGFGDGLNTTIWTSDNQIRMDIAEIAQNQLKQVGINAEVKILEWGSFLEVLENKELDIYIIGITASTGDGDALFNQFYSTSHFSGNTAFFQNAEVDEILEKTRVAIDEEERAQYLEEAQQLIMSQAPWIPVWHGEHSIGMRNDVAGFKNHPTGSHDLKNVHFE